MNLTPQDLLWLQRAHIKAEAEPSREDLKARITMLTDELARANERHRHAWNARVAVIAEWARDRHLVEEAVRRSNRWYRAWKWTFTALLVAVAVLILTWGCVR